LCAKRRKIYICNAWHKVSSGEKKSCTHINLYVQPHTGSRQTCIFVIEKQKNDGRVPWGFAARLLKEGKETFPSISTGDSETTTGDSNGSTDSESEVGSINSGSNGSADGSAYSESTVESIRLGGLQRIMVFVILYLSFDAETFLIVRYLLRSSWKTDYITFRSENLGIIMKLVL
jgi:hypothetical protein